MNIKIENLTKNYGNKQALKGINLNISEKKIIGLIGPNGSGKTTLIKILNGLLTPSSGDVKFDGHDVGKYSKMNVSYLPDKTYLSEGQKIYQISNMFKDFYPDYDERTFYDLLSKLSIDPKAKLSTLSKGNKEKVQLALVMSRKAQIYILDEPIAGVDPLAREQILETILSSYNTESTLIISTHLLQDIENILDEVIMIKNGEIIMHGDVDSIREKTGKTLNEAFKEIMR